MDYLREVSVSRLKEDFLTQYYGLLSLQEQAGAFAGLSAVEGTQAAVCVLAVLSARTPDSKTRAGCGKG